MTCPGCHECAGCMFVQAVCVCRQYVCSGCMFVQAVCVCRLYVCAGCMCVQAVCVGLYRNEYAIWQQMNG